MNPRRMWLPYAALLASIVLAIGASFLPDARLWGVNHFAFLPPALRLSALAIVLVSMIPAVSRAGYALLAQRPGRTTSRVALIGGTLIALGLFLALPAATMLLGDGVFIANNLETATARDLEFVAYAREVADSRLAYVGTALLNFLASKSALASSGGDALAGIRWLNAFLGALLVASVLANLSRSARPTWMAAAAALAIGGGAMMLFFGYVETYAPALLAGTLYIFTAVQALHRRAPLWRPVVLFTIGLVLHAQTLLLAPSLVYLLAARAWQRKQPARARAIVPWILGVVTLAALTARMIPAAQKHFLGLTDLAAGVFSPAHVADVFNVVLLLVPSGLVMLALALVPASRALARDFMRPTGAFVACLFVPALLFLVLFKPALGLWRDWDLYAFTSLGFVALGSMLVRRWLSRPAWARHHARIVTPAIVFSVVMTGAWVLVNADAERAVRRFEATLAYDQTAAGYANESLARYYERDAQPARAADAMDRAYAFRHNLRFLYKASTLRDRAGETSKAIEGLEQVLERAPAHDDARIALLGILIDEDRAEDVLRVAQAGISASPDHFMYPYASGRVLISMGRFDEGIQYFRRAQQLGPPVEIGQEMAEIVAEIRRQQGSK